MKRSIPSVALASALFASGVLGPSISAQNLITNGDFETGDLTGWSVNSTGGFGDWIVNDGVSFVFAGPANTLSPIAGSFDLTQSANGPGTQIASTSFVVPPTVNSAVVIWADTIRSFTTFQDPGQEYSVYFSDINGVQVGPTLFSTDPGNVLMPPTQTRAFDVTSILQSQAGSMMNLVFESDANTFFLHVSVDDVGLFVNQPSGPAATVEFGSGCPDGGAIYELFPGGTEDVANSTITFTPSTQTSGYVVTQGGPAMDPPGNQLFLLDDEVVAGLPLGFTFDYPGGSTNFVDVSSNGYLYLQSGSITDSRCCDGNPLLFANESASIAVFGADLDPSAGGQVYLDLRADRLTVTWEDVPNFGTSIPVDAQVQIHDDGRIVLLYGANAVGASNDTIIGVSPGMVRDPGSRDLSALDGELLSSLRPLRLGSDSGRPLVGTQFRWRISEIPAGAVSGVLLLGFTPLSVNLGVIGAPECLLLTSGLDALPFTALVPTATTVLNIPNRPGLSGVFLETQALAIVPGINALNVVTSNGLRLLVGSF